MTDTPSSPTDPADADLLASLYLDGEATADERARVEADPELLARVRAFETVAEDLSSVTPPTDLGRAQIAAALDLFDQQQATPPLAAVAEPEIPAAVTSLADRRKARQSRGFPTWLGVAAAGALVVGGLGFASTLGGDTDTSTSDVAMDSADDASASGANRLVEEDDAAESMMAETAPTTAADAGDDGDAMEESSDAMEDEEAMEDEAMEDDAMEESAADDAADGELVDLSPIPLDGLDANTAAGYLELLSDQPLQPISGSPCADSPLVEGLFGVDSYLPVVLDGQISSLVVQAGSPATARIVGPTCEIELE